MIAETVCIQSSVLILPSSKCLFCKMFRQEIKFSDRFLGVNCTWSIPIILRFGISNKKTIEID